MILGRDSEFTWRDFNRLREIDAEHTGIVVSDDKFNMFYVRLGERLRARGNTACRRLN